MKTMKKIKGFTIIEVVLVLAIAGLIFLMVFVALPALQRGQRDSARKNDVGIVLTAVNSFTGNNKGAMPTSAQLQSYITDVSTNTTLNGITVIAQGTLTIAPSDQTITVIPKTKCDTITPATATAGITQNLIASYGFSVITKLESGNGTPFCQNS